MIINGVTAPAPTPAIVFYFNGINTELCENNILKGVFGVDCHEYIFDNDINNGLDGGMFIFMFWFSVFVVPFVLLHLVHANYY